MVVLAASVASLSSLGAVVADERDAPSEEEFVGRINAERAAHGLDGLVVAPDLADVARRHSAEMAASGRLEHNAELGEEVEGWRRLGENVGAGPSVDDVHGAFMASDVHRDVLLAEFSEVGVGVRWVDGQMWVTQVLREPAQRAAGSGTREPEPEPAPASEPRPEPRRVSSIAPPPATPPASQATPTPAPPATPEAPTASMAAPAPPSAPTPAPPVAAAPPPPPTHEPSGPTAGSSTEHAAARPLVVGPARVPTPVAVAAGLLAAVVAVQGAALRRLRLV